MADLRIPNQPLPDFHPEDIQLAIGGYGPSEFQKELQAFIKKHARHFSQATLCQLLGVDYHQLPKLKDGYGTNTAQAFIVLKPMADLEADQIKFQAGVI